MLNEGIIIIHVLVHQHCKADPIVAIGLDLFLGISRIDIDFCDLGQSSS